MPRLDTRESAPVGRSQAIAIGLALLLCLAWLAGVMSAYERFGQEGAAPVRGEAVEASAAGATLPDLPGTDLPGAPGVVAVPALPLPGR